MGLQTGRARVPLHGVLLTLIIILAFASRALRCAEGLPYLHNWDEPQTATSALRIMQTGDYNPHFFHYGSVMIYMNLAVDVAHYFYLMTKPETEASSLWSLEEIETRHDTGYHWTISHPSFYLWNRLLTALMGTGSVLITYLLARDLKGPWAGILSAGLLAGMESHIEHSALVTPNVPMAFFGLAGVLLSVRYLRTGTPGSLVAAAAACGLAASTKYNTAVSIVSPLLALGLAWWGRRPGYRGWLWAAVVMAAPLAFIAGTPYAVLDLQHFLSDAGYEIWHYKVSGQSGTAIEPGMTHLLGQLRITTERIGVLPALFVPFGLAAASITAPGLVTFAFPAAYLIFMSTTVILEQRNLVVLYPFASIAFGCGVMVLYDLIGRTRMGTVGLRRVRTTLFIAAALACAAGTVRSLPVSWELARERETRSIAIDKVNELTAGSAGSSHRVGIAEELRVHRIDLARLKVPYEQAPSLDLLCADAGKYGLIVTATDIRGNRTGEREGAELLNSLASSRMSPVTTVGGSRWMHLDNLNKDPGIRILSRARGLPADPSCSGILELHSTPPDGESPPVDPTRSDLSGGRAASTGWLRREPGPHALIWYASGTSKSGVAPQIRCTLSLRFGGVVAERERWTIDLSKLETPYAVRFEAPDGAEVSLGFEKSGGGQVHLWSARTIDLSRTGPPAGGTGPAPSGDHTADR